MRYSERGRKYKNQCANLVPNSRGTQLISEGNHPSFRLATYTSVGGVICVVLVKEDHGWYAFFCTDPNASVVETLQAFADRATIEQVFHDVKEVWGAGQQQVRNIWNNLAVYNLNLWMYALVELWAWDRSGEQLVDRSDSPWDNPTRRPSHANRRKALREQIMQNELSTIVAT